MPTIRDEFGHNQIWNPSAANEHRAQRRIQKIVSALKPNSHVLELGCGSGQMTGALLRAGHRVTALDRSAQMIALTRQNCRDFSELHFENDSLIPFLEKSTTDFDAIVGIGILHHEFEQLERVLDLILNRLRPKGLGLFFEPNAMNPIAQLIFGTSLGRRWMRLEPQENALVQKEVCHFFEKAGVSFEVDPQDWAYPGLPIFLQNFFHSLETKAPSVLRQRISQSLFISFSKSADRSARIERPI